MPRYIALLRGINVGGHRVKMADLKEHFESLGVAAVETFIASGNVAFQSPVRSSSTLEEQVEKHLRAVLGYEVPTFIRTTAELREIAGFQPFAEYAPGDEGRTLSVLFMKEPVASEMQERLASFETELDRLRVHGRELYWLTGPRISDSPLDWTGLGKQVLLPPTTMRNATTVRRMAEKYPPT